MIGPTEMLIACLQWRASTFLASQCCAEVREAGQRG